MVVFLFAAWFATSLSSLQLRLTLNFSATTKESDSIVHPFYFLGSPKRSHMYWLSLASGQVKSSSWTVTLEPNQFTLDHILLLASAGTLYLLLFIVMILERKGSQFICTICASKVQMLILQPEEVPYTTT